jgi:hypothetical protein
MLPADFCNLKHDVRTLSPGLSFPRRDGGHDHLPFLTRHARPPLVAQRSGERAASRAPVRRPRSRCRFTPTCVGLPDRDTSTDAPPPSACASGVQWRLTCTGLWTERRTCPRSGGRLLGVTSKSACAWRTLTTFPSSLFQRTPVVAGAFACLGTSPLQTRRTSQDSPSSVRPRRLTTSRESGCLPPLRRGHVRGLLLFVSRAGPPLTPPTRCPHGWGQCAFEGIASLPVGITRRGLRRSRTPFKPR